MEVQELYRGRLIDHIQIVVNDLQLRFTLPFRRETKKW